MTDIFCPVIYINYDQTCDPPSCFQTAHKKKKYPAASTVPILS